MVHNAGRWCTMWSCTVEVGSNAYGPTVHKNWCAVKEAIGTYICKLSLLTDIRVSIIHELFPIICMSTIHRKFPIPSTANFLLEGRASSSQNSRLFLYMGNLLLRGWESCYKWVKLQIIGNGS